MTNIALVESVIEELRQFYGQEIYGTISTSMSKRKKSVKFVLCLIGIGKNYAAFNFCALVVVLLFIRLFRFPESGKQIFQYGATENNVAAFNKLNSCLSPALVEYTSMNFRNASWKDRVVSVLSITSVWEAAQLLSTDCHADPLVQVRSTIGAAACILYSVRPLPDSIEVLCVASDHAPVARALVSLSKERNTKTCYVQHARVTEYFPPLNTDLSVLYDEVSLDVYRRSAELSGKAFDARTVFMPPFSESFRQPDVRGEFHRIGLCLSRFPEIDRLLPVVSHLSSLSYVNNIILRPHPACRLDLSLLLSCEKVSAQPVGQSLVDFSASIDVALVPSSGVAVELLHNGIATFYLEGVDDLPDDYYGFVRDGILPKFNQDLLSSAESINALFDEKWKSKFSNYDVTVSRSIDDCRHAVSREFETLLAS